MVRKPERQAGVDERRRGLTLVELAVILSVIAILTAVLVPTVMSHVAQGRLFRARQDVRTLADAIVRFYQDTGFVPRTTDSVGGRAGQNVVDMLVSPGDAPALAEGADGVGRWVTGTTDLFQNHLVNNIPGYNLKGPEGGFGWSGSYFSSVLQPDPWGNRYMVNIVFLEPGEGVVSRAGGPKRAVYMLSAGADGVIQTAFEQPVTEASLGGDDIVWRLQ